MMQKIKGWLRAPHFEDPDQQRRAGYVNAILLTAVALVVPIIGLRSLGGELLSAQNNLLLGLAAALLGLRWLLGRGYLTSVSYLLVLTIAGGLTALAWSADGIHDVAFLANILAVVAAALLIGWQGSVAALGFTIVAAWVMALAESTGRLRPTLDLATNFARDYTAILILFGLLIYFLRTSLESAAEEAKTSAAAARATNVELETLQSELALRVDQRTAELERLNAVASRRVEQLRSVSDVASAIASLQDIDELLTRVTELISSQFHFYHAGIFLIDPGRRFAELRAANSDGGARMLARHHRLSMGGSGIVPNVASTGRPRVTPDVLDDPFFLKNPDLPDTRSEMALPLAIGQKIIGVLDVQSNEPNAFAEEDIDVLLTLANQVAIAMENARLFGETRRALQDVENAYHGFLRREWSGFARNLELVGVHHDGGLIETIYLDSTSADVPGDGGLVVPITLRGDVVGELDIGPAAQKRAWSEDELAVFRATADRVAVALENARLMHGAQRRAERERLIGEISAKIASTSDLEDVIQTAVEELGRSLPEAEVTIQFQGAEG